MVKYTATVLITADFSADRLAQAEERAFEIADTIEVDRAYKLPTWFDRSNVEIIVEEVEEI